ncbi:MAG: glycosyltransferase family 2 protein [Planctomycetota bacterium]
MSAAVRVIVPMFDSARTVGETLRSLEAQTFRDWRCVVVDDGSTDDGPENVREFALRDARFEMIRKANGGLASARNAGLEVEGTERFVHFLDADDWMEGDGLGVLVEALESSRDGAAAGGVIVRDDAGSEIARREPPEGSFGLFELRSMATVVTHAQLFRREAIGAFRFDESRRRVEDYELWFRLAESGLTWATTDRAVCGYRMRTGSISSSFESMMEHTLAVLGESRRRCPGVATPDNAMVDAGVQWNWATRRAMVSPGEAEAAAGMLRRGDPVVSAVTAARAVVDAAVFGLARCPSEIEGSLRDSAMAWWRVAGSIVELPDGFAAEAERALGDAIAGPEVVASRVLDRAIGGGEHGRVRLIGYGQNGRRLARVARGRGVEVVVRDDRAVVMAEAGVSVEPISGPLDDGTPTIVTLSDDGALLDRLRGMGADVGSLVRWCAS